MKKLIALVVAGALLALAGCQTSCKTDKDCQMTKQEKATYFGD